MSVNLMGMSSLSAMMGGLDYSQIIQQLYQVDRAPGDALNQYIQNDELKKSDWSNISSLANQVQTALVTLADSSTFTSSTATSSDDTIVAATTGSNAAPGTYAIGITSAGTVSSFTSGTQVGGAVAGLSDTFNETKYSQPITAGSVNVTIGNTTHSISVASTDSFQNFIDNINTAFAYNPGSTGVGITGSISGNKFTLTNTSGSTIALGSAGDSSNLLSVIGLAGNQVSNGSNVTSSTLGHVQTGTVLGNASANFATPIQITGGTTSSNIGYISVNGVNISYNVTSDTLQSVINKINSSTAGVTAAYDPIQDKVTLTSKTSQPISVSDITDPSSPSTGTKGNLAVALGLSGTSTGSTNQWTYTISTNGGPTQTLTSDSATVTNVIPGVTFNLLGASGTSATVTVAQNTDSLTKNLNAFTAAFNSLYSQLNSYTKLHGDLQGDPAAAQLGFKLMNDVLAPLKNMSQYPNQSVVGIGISNGAIGSAPGNTNSLVVDKDTLLAAFQSNPSEVQALIQGMASQLDADLTGITGNFDGLTPLTSANANMVSIASSESSMYDSEISSIQNQQQQIYDQADSAEQLMLQQFTQLQEYQSQMSAQQQAMSAMMASLP